ncbi:MAG: hypothetical protein OEX02_06460 [Cyclobacteriaceae bacterium]|nr:hypothetical protein [Cyclobacteriaceae bacterium]
MITLKQLSPESFNLKALQQEEYGYRIPAKLKTIPQELSGKIIWGCAHAGTGEWILSSYAEDMENTRPVKTNDNTKESVYYVERADRGCLLKYSINKEDMQNDLVLSLIKHDAGRVKTGLYNIIKKSSAQKEVTKSPFA